MMMFLQCSYHRSTSTDDESLNIGCVSATVCILLAMIYLNISLFFFLRQSFMYPKLASNWLSSQFLHLLSAEIKGMLPYTRYVVLGINSGLPTSKAGILPTEAHPWPTSNVCIESFYPFPYCIPALVSGLLPSYFLQMCQFDKR